MSARAAAAAVVAPALVFVAVAVVACGETVAQNTGLDEPIRIEGAQFFPGALPGLPSPANPLDAGPPVTPYVSGVTPSATLIDPGTAAVDLMGNASPTTQTVGVRFADLGTGYWVFPTQGADPNAGNSQTWEAFADFSRDLPSGVHQLLFAGIDGNGGSGTQFEISFCVDTPVPDNLNACAPSHAPPAAVLSLSWDTHVDLDLIVQAPNGVMVGGKNVTTAPAGTTVSAAGGGSFGVLDHDSNRNCVIDGIDREDIVWQTAPLAGTYEVWADLNSACGQASVRFSVALWIPEPTGDGGTHLVQQTPLATGELLAAQANGGSAPGLYVGSFSFH